MKTIPWQFRWMHNDKQQTFKITGLKHSQAIEQLGRVLANELAENDTISSWIEIKNLRLGTIAFIKSQSVLKDYYTVA